MALTKEIVVDKIEVMELGHIQVRTVTKILEDGVQLSSSFHRKVLDPSTKSGDPLTWGDTDISGEDARVQAVANATWTAEVKTAFHDKMDAQAL